MGTDKKDILKNSGLNITEFANRRTPYILIPGAHPLICDCLGNTFESLEKLCEFYGITVNELDQALKGGKTLYAVLGYEETVYRHRIKNIFKMTSESTKDETGEATSLLKNGDKKDDIPAQTEFNALEEESTSPDFLNYVKRFLCPAADKKRSYSSTMKAYDKAIHDGFNIANAVEAAKQRGDIKKANALYMSLVQLLKDFNETIMPGASRHRRTRSELALSTAAKILKAELHTKSDKKIKGNDILKTASFERAVENALTLYGNDLSDISEQNEKALLSYETNALSNTVKTPAPESKTDKKKKAANETADDKDQLKFSDIPAPISAEDSYTDKDVFEIPSVNDQSVSDEDKLKVYLEYIAFGNGDPSQEDIILVKDMFKRNSPRYKSAVRILMWHTGFTKNKAHRMKPFLNEIVVFCQNYFDKHPDALIKLQDEEAITPHITNTSTETTNEPATEEIHTVQDDKTEGSTFSDGKGSINESNTKAKIEISNEDTVSEPPKASFVPLKAEDVTSPYNMNVGEKVKVEEYLKVLVDGDIVIGDMFDPQSPRYEDASPFLSWHTGETTNKEAKRQYPVINKLIAFCRKYFKSHPNDIEILSPYKKHVSPEFKDKSAITAESNPQAEGIADKETTYITKESTDVQETIPVDSSVEQPYSQNQQKKSSEKKEKQATKDKSKTSRKRICPAVEEAEEAIRKRRKDRKSDRHILFDSTLIKCLKIANEAEDIYAEKGICQEAVDKYNEAAQIMANCSVSNISSRKQHFATIVELNISSALATIGKKLKAAPLTSFIGTSIFDGE